MCSLASSCSEPLKVLSRSSLRNFPFSSNWALASILGLAMPDSYSPRVLLYCSIVSAIIFVTSSFSMCSSISEIWSNSGDFDYAKLGVSKSFLLERSTRSGFSKGVLLLYQLTNTLYPIEQNTPYRDNTYWWHDHKSEEKERRQLRIDIEEYDPPMVHVETFKVKRYSFDTGQSFICVTKELMDALQLGRENGSRFREMIRKEVLFLRNGIRSSLNSCSCGSKVLSGRNPIGYAVTYIIIAGNEVVLLMLGKKSSLEEESNTQGSLLF
ncbi:hypothetical protein Tco_0725442 [Tanacetum coccineum]|uniref:Uncharacterized protein n=1 Tax=Tanacetum coccineum TaxID=301880 RepID=A0ABQ4YDR4_9ASTR